MKSFFKNIKRNKKWIISCIVILVLVGVFMLFNSRTYAVVNPEFYQADDSEIATYFKNLLGSFVQTGAGVLAKPISLLVNLTSFLLIAVMYVIFVSSGVSNGFAFPFPDQIVFNGLSMLDPNFINPTSDSGAIVNLMQGIIQNIYYSFFALAGTVFVLAAVIIGIKLAFSALASEKAQYKEAIKHYIIGLLILFVIHFALAGMFAINEKICIEASKICKNVTVKVNAFEFAPEVGSFIKGMINNIGSIFGNPDVTSFADLEVKGYGGVVIKFVVKGVLQTDLIYSIGLMIILGQTFSLIVMYLKRLFYCIILGMIAPLIVAMDTIQKVVTGKDSGILKNWFQNIVAIIFNQSFQAIFMCITLLIIGKLETVNAGSGNNDLIEAIVAVIAVHSLMKFDKLFKELLGIKDSKIMGGLNENAMRSFAAIKSGLALARRSTEPFQKRVQAKLRYNEAAKKRNKAIDNLAKLNSGSSGSPNTSDGNGLTNALNNSTSNQTQGLNRSGNGSENNLGTQQIVDALNRLGVALDQNTKAQGGDTGKIADKREKLMNEIAEAEAEMKKARADQRAESLRAFTRFGTSVGSVAFGVGATDNFSDAVTVGNIIDIPMDKLTDRTVDRGVYGNTSRKLEGRKEALVNKYVEKGIDVGDAQKLAQQSIDNIQKQLNSAIPESIGNMVTDITKETIKGVADVANRQGRKYAKKASKEIYKAGKIDDI